MLSKELHAQGQWLFRHRSYLPLILLIFIVLSLLPTRPLTPYPLYHHIYNGFCLFVAVVGFGIRIITIGQVPRRTSGRNTHKQIADELNTTGIYSQIRHPLYLGNFLMWFGVILYTQHVWFIIFFCVTYALYYERIMLAEEEFLSEKFGKAYAEWSRFTPAFYPRCKNWKTSKLTFSMRNVLKREYSGLLGMVVSFCIVEVLYNLIHVHKLVLSKGWIIALIAAAVVYIVLRTLKRSTRILHVEGR